VDGVGAPVSDVLSRVVGQDGAVAELRAAVRAPVHAYLLVGPPGAGQHAAALSFAAALLCPRAGCGSCDVCSRALAEAHPDLVVVEREGASISMGQAREIRRLALRTPNEGGRKVLVLTDFHLVQDAGPALLKVIEEPPPSTVFVILADHVPPELVTIASRCVQIVFRAIDRQLLVRLLVADGTDPVTAEEVARASGGRLDRARLLAGDPGFGARREVWRTLPFRLDGTGAAVAVLAAELVELLGDAAVEPLRARHAAEVAALEARVERSGERGAGRAALAERHKRELRRLRTDELRFGLAVLAQSYRDALVAHATEGRNCLAAVQAIQDAAEALARNPKEDLLLQALLLRLSPLRRHATVGPEAAAEEAV
jgi:DNA polymerase III subunit delta'